MPKLLGIDGRKMSKSYDNAIFLSDRGEELRKKIEVDPARPRLIANEPGVGYRLRVLE